MTMTEATKASTDETAPFRIDSALGFWEIASVRPDRVAVVDPEGRETTFGELRRWSDALSHGLRSLGLTTGDTVALVMGNASAFLAVQLATSQLGLYITPINRHLTGPEIGYILGDSDAKVLIAGAEFAEVAGRAADIAGLPVDQRFTDDAVSGFRNLTELSEVAAGASVAAPAHRRFGGRMLYTSGTTGRPKGVRKPLPDAIPERVLAHQLPTVTRQNGWPPGDGAHLVVAPLYHAAPNSHAMHALHIGNTVVLMEKWLPELMLQLIPRYRITSTHMVPTMFHRLLALTEDVRAAYDLSSLNYVVHGAAPCPVHEKHAMLRWWGPIIWEYYASTEGGGTSVSPTEWLEHPGTVGRAWEGAAVKVLDDSGNEAQPGVVGTVYLLGGGGFEYFKDPQKTEAARRGDFFTPGDMGHLDQDGWLYLADRRSDLIISGGVNIYPAEIEAALLAHSAVADVGVVGLPDDDFGSRVHAVVQLADGAIASDALVQTLMEFSEDRLAKFKRPRSLEFRALPRTPTGKLSRIALRQELLGREDRGN
ncbi:AMP-binding protein [Streptomyces sp. NPDC102360]|uniref:AMP-binding protein n=1 Tax=Streptomyces sp. NPDC102360 TaxID=3366160 RepID=UPI00381AFDCC